MKTLLNEWEVTIVNNSHSLGIFIDNQELAGQFNLQRYFILQIDLINKTIELNKTFALHAGLDYNSVVNFETANEIIKKNYHPNYDQVWDDLITSQEEKIVSLRIDFYSLNDKKSSIQWSLIYKEGSIYSVGELKTTNHPIQLSGMHNGTTGVFSRLISRLERSREEYDFYNDFVSRSNDFYVLINDRGKIEFYNNRFKNLFLEFNEKEINLSDFFVGDKSIIASIISDLQLGFFVEDKIVDLKGGSGKIIKANISVSLMQNGYFGVVGFDISDDDLNDPTIMARQIMKLNRLLIRKNERLEEELEAKNEILDNLAKQKHELNEFVYRVSHDLRAPVSSLLGLLHLKEVDNTFSLDESQNSIANLTEQLDQTIFQIINHFQNKERSINLKALDLDGLIQQLVQNYRSNITNKNVKVTILVDDVNIISDHALLYSLLNGIISNAFKFKSLQERVHEISIHSTLKKDSITIYVTDNGLGIDRGIHESIYLPFYRGNAFYFGSGLGLYITKTAADKLGVKLSFHSIMDKGTTFKIEIPKVSL